MKKISYKKIENNQYKVYYYNEDNEFKYFVTVDSIEDVFTCIKQYIEQDLYFRPMSLRSVEVNI